jgi:hypothetical protein
MSRPGINNRFRWDLKGGELASLVQKVIDAGIFRPLVDVLSSADFKTRKEVFSFPSPFDQP